MTKVKGTDALEALKERYGHEPGFEEGVEEAREQMKIAQLIYDARTEAGLTQKQLADLIGSRQSVISRLEQADYEGYSIPLLRRIANALNKRVELQMVPLKTSHVPKTGGKGKRSNP